MARIWPEEIGREIDAFMKRSLKRFVDATCPIFLTVPGRPIVSLGSGVLLRIAHKFFLLTAAHVMDGKQDGRLSMPGGNGDIGLSGYHSNIRMPPSGRRMDDKYDIAYVRLTDETVQSIHPDFKFLGFDDLDLFDTSIKGDAYSFIGYPARRAAISGRTIQSQFGSFSGDGLGPIEVNRLHYNPQHHILIRFRRHKTTNYFKGQREAAVHPEGLSGGAVVAWDKNMEERDGLPPSPKLVGILTTYYAAQHYLVATRINCFLSCIRKNNRDLPFVSAPAFDHSARR